MNGLKQKLNINKIGVKNVFLLLLLMLVTAVTGVISKSVSKSTKGKIVGADVANAQSCWAQTNTYPPAGSAASEGCGSCGEGGGSGEGGSY